MSKLVCISDTHNQHKKITIPECDILIHSGDSTSYGRKHEVKAFAEWFEKQPATHKIFVPGNHELEWYNAMKEDQSNRSWFTDYAPSVHLLINESITINNLKFYGSPVTPFFYDWAWNAFPEELIQTWSNIPDDTDVLITHGPPYTILDTIHPEGHSANLGCSQLFQRVKELNSLKLHIFGHIHGCGGQTTTIPDQDTIFCNAAVCAEDYRPSNQILTIHGA